jgi:ribosome maturation factor RimP
LITREQILRLAEAHLKDSPLFVTAVKIGSGNQISVFIDGDEGVRIDDCVALSRAIESQLDRDREDFSLDVSSHGATAPLVSPRQYRRHLGREIEVRLVDGGKAEGRLGSVDEAGVTIGWDEREPKPVGKGKTTVHKTRNIPFAGIAEARIKLKF